MTPHSASIRRTVKHPAPYTELVYQEAATTLSAELGAIVARDHSDCIWLSDMGTASHNYAAAGLTTIRAPASDIEPLESASPYTGASTHPTSNGESCICTQDTPAFPAALDERPLICQHSTAENTSNYIRCDEWISSA